MTSAARQPTRATTIAVDRSHGKIYASSRKGGISNVVDVARFISDSPPRVPLGLRGKNVTIGRRSVLRRTILAGGKTRRVRAIIGGEYRGRRKKKRRKIRSVDGKGSLSTTRAAKRSLF